MIAFTPCYCRSMSTMPAKSSSPSAAPELRIKACPAGDLLPVGLSPLEGNAEGGASHSSLAPALNTAVNLKSGLQILLSTQQSAVFLQTVQVMPMPPGGRTHACFPPFRRRSMEPFPLCCCPGEMISTNELISMNWAWHCL